MVVTKKSASFLHISLKRYCKFKNNSYLRNRNKDETINNKDHETVHYPNQRQ